MAKVFFFSFLFKLYLGISNVKFDQFILVFVPPFLIDFFLPFHFYFLFEKDVILNFFVIYLMHNTL